MQLLFAHAFDIIKVRITGRQWWSRWLVAATGASRVERTPKEVQSNDDMGAGVYRKGPQCHGVARASRSNRTGLDPDADLRGASRSHITKSRYAGPSQAGQHGNTVRDDAQELVAPDWREGHGFA